MTLPMGSGTEHTRGLGGGFLPLVCLCAYMLAQIILVASHDPHHHTDDSLSICDVCVVKDTLDPFKKPAPVVLVPFSGAENAPLAMAESRLRAVWLRRAQPRAPPHSSALPFSM